jgi:hypothetical protein
MGRFFVVSVMAAMLALAGAAARGSWGLGGILMIGCNRACLGIPTLAAVAIWQE